MTVGDASGGTERVTLLYRFSTIAAAYLLLCRGQRVDESGGNAWLEPQGGAGELRAVNAPYA